MEYLKDGETIEAVVFGKYGWGGFDEDEESPVPSNVQEKVLTLAEAEPYMHGWSFYGGYGAPECYAVYVWTNQRVIWVTQYDGATNLSSAPRNPTPCTPTMPGG
jgi:hypothetical protein